MKNLLSALLLTLFFHQLPAQVVFCPPGAEWHYSFNRMAFSSPVYKWHNEKIKYERDTVVNSETLKILVHKRYYQRQSNTDPYANLLTYIKQKGDTVFFNNFTTNGWQVLYNFAAQAGQSWQNVISLMPTWTPSALTYTVMVDSVKTVLVNTFPLRRLYARYIADIYDKNGWSLIRNVDTVTIDERMGCSEFMFNFHNRRMTNEYTEYFGGFLCYSDDAFGTKHFSERPCDYMDYVGLSENTYPGGNIQVFPNPVAETFQLSAAHELLPEACTLLITDLCGRTVKLLALNSFDAQVPVADLEDGAYLLSLEQQGRIIYTTKLLKQQYR